MTAKVTKKVTKKAPQDRKPKTTGRTTQPRVKPEVTSASEWKKASEGRELELPSGNVCLARNPGLEAFIRQGFIPDSLLPLVNRALEGDEVGEQEARAAVQEDPENLEKMFATIDAVVLHCVIKPKVEPVPAQVRSEGGELADAPRNPDFLYVDDVDFQDKSFIFQWAVGGTHDLETFRRGQEAGLANL